MPHALRGPPDGSWEGSGSICGRMGWFEGGKLPIYTPNNPNKLHKSTRKLTKGAPSKEYPLTIVRDPAAGARAGRSQSSALPISAGPIAHLLHPEAFAQSGLPLG